jgi:hypothetical protein
MILLIGPEISDTNLAESYKYFMKFSTVIAGCLITTPPLRSYFDGALEPKLLFNQLLKGLSSGF